MSRLSPDARWSLLQDVVQASTQPGQPVPLFQAVDNALGGLVGHKLFSLTVLDQQSGEAERFYSNQPDAYPVSGRQMGTSKNLPFVAGF